MYQELMSMSQVKFGEWVRRYLETGQGDINPRRILLEYPQEDHDFSLVWREVVKAFRTLREVAGAEQLLLEAKAPIERMLVDMEQDKCRISDPRLFLDIVTYLTTLEVVSPELANKWKKLAGLDVGICLSKQVGRLCPGAGANWITGIRALQAFFGAFPAPKEASAAA